jgi:hypothetical protein
MAGTLSLCPPYESGKIARRHFERSEAIQSPSTAGSLDCFVACAPRNDVNPRRTFSFPRRIVRPSLVSISSLSNRGRREDRVPAAPAASCAVKKAHELFTTGSTGATRPSLRNGFNDVVRALPGVRDLIVTVAFGSSPASLAPAQGCQDHTPSPSARDTTRQLMCPRPSLPASRVVTIAKRPLAESG